MAEGLSLRRKSENGVGWIWQIFGVLYFCWSGHTCRPERRREERQKRKRRRRRAVWWFGGEKEGDLAKIGWVSEGCSRATMKRHPFSASFHIVRVGWVELGREGGGGVGGGAPAMHKAAARSWRQINRPLAPRLSDKATQSHWKGCMIKPPLGIWCQEAPQTRLQAAQQHTKSALHWRIFGNLDFCLTTSGQCQQWNKSNVKETSHVALLLTKSQTGAAKLHHGRCCESDSIAAKCSMLTSYHQSQTARPHS